MFKLKNVEIKGFWGEYKVSSAIKNDVNIFIGKNGTGKTTFINILQAALTVDIELLYNLQFDSITLNLYYKKKRRKIQVTKMNKDFDLSHIEYKIGTSKYELPAYAIRESFSRNYRNKRIHPKIRRTILDIRDTLSNLINISYLSVHRENLFHDDYYNESKREAISNSIDSKLDNLISKLTSFQFQLETELSGLSKSFQENVLRTMLFNPEFDHVNISEPINLKIKEIRVGLKQAYRELGILDSETTAIIEQHVKAINKATVSINKHANDNKKPIYPNDVTPLTILKRTRKIIELSSKLEEEKKVLFKPIRDYLALINEFSDNKSYELSDETNTGFVITNNNTEIEISELSSGEKQLIILLTETLLQKESETIFIADEPELSLHIEWQRKIIPSIRKLNPNAQIIVATHSPEIVGKWKNNTINMKKITHG